MSWFEEWFDSPLYEFLYAYRNEEEANKLADLIEREIPVSAYNKVVDVGCGRGRHSITLAQRGYKVTGFDLSQTAIKKAKQKAAGRGLQNIDFRVQDMRIPLSERFDAAVNLFTTFGYFLDTEENVKVLENVNRMLNPSGRFLIDFMNSTKVERDLVPEESGTHKGIDYTIKRYIENGCVYKEVHFSGDEISSPQEFTERVQLFDKNWFVTKLNEAGFRTLNIWGSYGGEPFDEINSPRLIILSEARDSSH